jgi:putative oxidoreductase
MLPAGEAVGMRERARSAIERLAWPALLVAPPMLRIALAIPFFRSGLTKWDGLSLSPAALYLFENEFKLHLFGAAYDFPLPALAATGAAMGEIIFPILLVLGLGTRLAALGILAMTIVIQLTVPDGWLTYHLPWAAMALALIAIGPGFLSIDRLLFGSRPSA